MRDERLEAYRRLFDGLYDMVEDGRLSRADHPDDYEWLIAAMLEVVRRDPESKMPEQPPTCPECEQPIRGDESSMVSEGREYHIECA